MIQQNNLMSIVRSFIGRIWLIFKSLVSGVFPAEMKIGAENTLEVSIHSRRATVPKLTAATTDRVESKWRLAGVWCKVGISQVGLGPIINATCCFPNKKKMVANSKLSCNGSLSSCQRWKGQNSLYYCSEGHTQSTGRAVNVGSSQHTKVHSVPAQPRRLQSCFENVTRGKVVSCD